MGRARSWLTYANVMATLGVFLALGGASYAALKLPKNSIGPRQIKTGAVGSSEVKNRSLAKKDFKRGALLKGPKGDPGTNASVNGVTAGGDLSGTFPNPSIRDGAVTPQKLARWPSVLVYRTTDQPLGTLNWTAEEYDPFNMHNSASKQDRLVAPRAGTYLFSASVCTSPSAGTESDVFLSKNGNDLAYFQGASDPATGRSTCAQASRQVRLNASDFVTATADSSNQAVTVSGGEPQVNAQLTMIAP